MAAAGPPEDMTYGLNESTSKARQADRVIRGVNLLKVPRWGKGRSGTVTIPETHMSKPENWMVGIRKPFFQVPLLLVSGRVPWMVAGEFMAL